MAEVPLPGSWIKKDEPPKVVKRPFVRKPHLTNKPFKASEQLREFQKAMTKTTKRS